MHRLLHKLEVLVDRIIPYLLVFLLAIIFLDLFYSSVLDPYRFEIEVIDLTIIGFFIIDLCFKYYHTRNPLTFLKKYWIEIIAVLPFFLVARVIEEFIGLFAFSEDITRAQRIFHEGAAAEQKLAADIGRSYRFARIVRPIARMPRLAKALSFFRKPKKKGKAQ